MADSNVAIANLALTKLGDLRITDLDEDTKPAREVKAVFTMLRDKLLRRYTWRFSVKRAQLAASATAPEFGYEYQYPLPTDCLRVIQVGEFYPPPNLADLNTGNDAEWQIEGRSILHHQSGPLKIRYVRRVTDPVQFDACFDEAFACLIAHNTAEALTQSNSKKEAARQDFNQAIRDANFANAIENPPVSLADNAWLAARL